MNTTDPFSSVTWGANAFQETKPRRRRIFARSKSVYLRRGEAVIIDGLLTAIPILLVNYLFSLAFPNYGFFFAHTQTATSAYTTQTSATLHLGLSGSLLTLALWLVYYFVCEALTGQTIGKRRVGLRVMSSDGTPAGLNAISARTVLRILDSLPVLYLVGTLVAILSGRRRRRIGDLAGRTVVVADDGYLPRPQPTIWKLCVYPVGWICVVMLVIFAAGLGKAVGTQEEAVSLVHEYVNARQQHDATLACSLLTREQQRELVAVQTDDYRQASAGLCPRLILGTDPKSSLLNPGLGGLAEAQLQLAYLSGAVVLYSPAYPQIHLIAVSEAGKLKLDVRGIQKLEFVAGCKSVGTISQTTCGCVWRVLRFHDELDESPTSTMAIESYRRATIACLANPAADSS